MEKFNKLFKFLEVKDFCDQIGFENFNIIKTEERPIGDIYEGKHFNKRIRIILPDDGSLLGTFEFYLKTKDIEFKLVSSPGKKWVFPHGFKPKEFKNFDYSELLKFSSLMGLELYVSFKEDYIMIDDSGKYHLAEASKGDILDYAKEHLRNRKQELKNENDFLKAGFKSKISLKKYIKKYDEIKVIDYQKLYEDNLISEELAYKFKAFDGASKALIYFKDVLNKQGLKWCYTMGNAGEPFYSGGNCWENYPFEDYSGKRVMVWDKNMTSPKTLSKKIFSKDIDLKYYDIVFVDRILE